MKGKKFLALVLVTVMVVAMIPGGVSAATEPNSANLIVGGNFDVANAGNNNPRPDWAGGTWTYTSTGGRNGTGGWKVTAKSTGNAAMWLGSRWATTGQGVAVGAGNYVFTVDVYRSSTAISAGLHMREDSDSSFNGWAPVYATGPAGQWETVTYHAFGLSAASAARHCTLQATGITGNEYVIFDNATLRRVGGTHDPADEVPAAPGANLVTNGNFNIANAGAFWPRTTGWDGGTVAYTSTRGVAGSGGYVFTGNGTAGKAVGLYEGGASVGRTLAADKTYLLTADVLVPSGSSATVNLRYANGGDGIVAVSDKAVADGTWQTLQLYVKGLGAKSYIGVVYSDTTNGEQILVDNLCIRECGASANPNENDPFAPLGANLITNGNFNIANAGAFWNREAGWNGGTVGYTSGGGMGGTGAKTFIGNGNTANAVGLYQGGATQGITLTNGTVYRLSADVYRAAGSNAAVRVRLNNGENDSIIASSDTAQKTGEWETVHMYIVGTGAKVYLAVHAQGLANGEIVKFDNFALRAVGGTADPTENDPFAAPGANLIANGNFNIASIGYFWPRVTGWDGGTVGYSTTLGRDGSGGYVFTGNGTAGKSLGLYQGGETEGIVLAADKVYLLTADVLVPAGSSATVNLRYANSGDGIVAVSDKAVADGAWQTLQMYIQGLGTKGFVAVAYSNTTNGEQILIDNFALREVGGTPDPNENDPPGAAGANLIESGNFNTANGGAFWARNDWGGGTVGYTSLTGIGGSGAKTFVGTGGAGGVGLYLGGSLQGTTLVDGMIYELSVQVFRTADSTASVQLLMNDANDAGIARTTVAVSTETWETLTMHVMGKGQKVYLGVTATGLAAGEVVKLDNLALREVGAAADPNENDPFANGGGNLIENGNFNIYNGGNITPRNLDWTGGTFAYTGYRGFGGTGAWIVSGTENPTLNAGLFIGIPGIQLEQGAIYELTAKVFTPDGSSAKAYVSARNVDDPFATSDPSGKTGEWEIIKVYLTGPAYPVTLSVHVNGLTDSSDYLIIDDVALRKVGDAPDPDEGVLGDADGVNHLANGNFNTGNGGSVWPRADWPGGKFSYTSTGGVDGTGGYLVTGTDSPAQNAALWINRAPLTLEAGKEYAFTVEVYRPEGVDATARLSLRRTDDSVLAESAAAEKNGEWETLTLHFVATSDPFCATLLVTGLEGAETMIFDNAAIRLVGGEADPNEGVWAPPGANLIKNGDFNIINGGAFWIRDDWNGGLFKYSTSKGVGGSGAYVATGTGEGLANQNAGLYMSPHKSPLELEEGEIYLLTAEVFRPEGVDAPVSLIVRNTDDSAICISDATVKNGEWETLQIYFVGPADPLQVTVCANALADGEEIIVDNVALRKLGGEADPDEGKEPAYGYNQLDNGDFNATNLKSWWLRTDWNGGKFSYAAGKGVDGSGALVANGTGEGLANQNAGLFYLKDAVKLEEGKTYLFTAQVFRPAGTSGTASLAVRGADDSVIFASDKTVLHGQWETIQIQFIAGANPVRLTLAANGLPDGQLLYVDNVELRLLGGALTGNPLTSPGMGDMQLVLMLTAAFGSLLAAGAALIARRKRISKI